MNNETVKKILEDYLIYRDTEIKDTLQQIEYKENAIKLLKEELSDMERERKEVQEFLNGNT